jgi:ADP-heptose:LPS heptosyltransferase
MGDLLMSSPAIRALKETFHSRITILTSSMASPIAKFIEEIDEVICYNLPWIKKDETVDNKSVIDLVEKLKAHQFDAAVIFTVYSQSPLPAAMVTYLAEIPMTLAYCRENPYQLLTHWVPEKEPYSVIRHQVRRDLDLVNSVGATTSEERLKLNISAQLTDNIKSKLSGFGIDTSKPWVILHAGVSEKKREFPPECWIEAAKALTSELGLQLLLTGAPSEKKLIDQLAKGIGAGAFPVAGLFSIDEFIGLVQIAPLLLSVNSGPVHIASATATPVIVLYALTNPQHLPWKVTGDALIYDVPSELRSKNEVIRFVNEHFLSNQARSVSSDNIVAAVKKILFDREIRMIPEMVPLNGVFRN